MGNRPRLNQIYLTKKIINEEISKFVINEILDKPIETSYEKFFNIRTYDGNRHDTYRFKTKNGFSYDVEFYRENIIFGEIHLLNGETLPDNNNIIATIGILIGFTPSEINNMDVPEGIIGTMDDPYVQKTKRNEQYEVLSKILYLVKEYIKNNSKYKIYIITKNTYENNLSVYNLMFENVFSIDFDKYEAEDAFYYIKK